ncbi:MAG: inner membrane-spanning protein YciB [Buchnera aphidicola (Tetraneura sorini)]
MKSLLNFIPMLTFFIAYKVKDIFMATNLLIVMSSIVCLINWTFYKKIEVIEMISFFFILFFGSLTTFFHNSNFIKMKVSVLYFLFSIALLVSFNLNKPIINFFINEMDVHLTKNQWQILNFAWSFFFFLCGVLNLYIIFYCSEMYWIYFKIIGLTIMTIIFMIINFLYIFYLKK